MPEKGGKNKNRGKDLSPTERLQIRTDVLIRSLDRAFTSGQLNPQLVRSFKNDAPDTHTDLLLVYLGLKPVATLLSREVNTESPHFYQRGFRIHNYIACFPSSKEGGNNVEASRAFEQHTDTITVWDPRAVERVIRKNPDTFPFDNMSFDYHQVSHLIHFTSEGDTPEMQRRYGLLLGFPKEAVDLFAMYGLPLNQLCDRVESESKQQGVSIFDPRTGLRPLGQVSDYQETKELMLMFMQEQGYMIDPKLMAYLKDFRSAQVPGFPYYTTGTLSNHERNLTKAWQDSRMDAKLDALLAKHKS